MPHSFLLASVCTMNYLLANRSTSDFHTGFVNAENKPMFLLCDHEIQFYCSTWFTLYKVPWSAAVSLKKQQNPKPCQKEHPRKVLFGTSYKISATVPTFPPHRVTVVITNVWAHTLYTSPSPGRPLELCTSLSKRTKHCVVVWQHHYTCLTFVTWALYGVTSKFLELAGFRKSFLTKFCNYSVQPGWKLYADRTSKLKEQTTASLRKKKFYFRPFLQSIAFGALWKRSLLFFSKMPVSVTHSRRARRKPFSNPVFFSISAAKGGELSTLLLFFNTLCTSRV